MSIINDERIVCQNNEIYIACKFNCSILLIRIENNWTLHNLIQITYQHISVDENVGYKRSCNICNKKVPIEGNYNQYMITHLYGRCSICKWCTFKAINCVKLYRAKLRWSVNYIFKERDIPLEITSIVLSIMFRSMTLRAYNLVPNNIYSLNSILVDQSFDKFVKKEEKLLMKTYEQSVNNNFKKINNPPNKSCNKCGKLGHYTSVCGVVCNKCGKLGHYANKCRQM